MEMEGSNVNENTTYIKSNYLFNQHIYISKLRDLFNT